MQSILESIKALLLMVQGPLADLASTFPRALLPIAFLSIIVTKQILCILEDIKK